MEMEMRYGTEGSSPDSICVVSYFLASFSPCSEVRDTPTPESTQEDIWLVFLRFLRQSDKISTLSTGETLLKTPLVISVALEIVMRQSDKISTLLTEETLLKTQLVISVALENSRG
ncbi:hypothetical protein E2C01_045611 [Portunus trituberculatus]|uniref:Uncharacterized protein n=1 Tax=Portunus trituberculatus TaxID=210409 RepID=A0A5B7G3L6_PORTR|nr:hypothetical protein [Portunus trituberculatus]